MRRKPTRVSAFADDRTRKMTIVSALLLLSVGAESGCCPALSLPPVEVVIKGQLTDAETLEGIPDAGLGAAWFTGGQEIACMFPMMSSEVQDLPYNVLSLDDDGFFEIYMNGTAVANLLCGKHLRFSDGLT